MIAMSSSKAADLAGAELIGADVAFEGLCTDSRKVQPGSLFVALSGERFDGHEYVSRAMDQGAVAAVVSSKQADCTSQVLVSDTKAALGKIASGWAAECPALVIGVTGSNGKTTIKSMLFEILKRAGETLVNEGNFNNEIGVPLTLARLRLEHEYAIVEMGASRPGDIAYLARLAQPLIGIVSNASQAHSQGLGEVAEIATEKGSLFASLPAEGCAVINADDPHCALWQRMTHSERRLTFGRAASADIRISRESAAGLTLESPLGKLNLALAVPGVHNELNAAAAAAAAIALGVDAAHIIDGLEAFAGVDGRLQVRSLPGDWEIIDDTYNANPASLAAGIQVVTDRSANAWLVLGDMAELGDAAAASHQEAGAVAKAAGITQLFAVGEYAELAAHEFGPGGQVFDNQEALIEAIFESVEPGVCCLIKGSRSAQLERVVDSLLERCGGRGSNAA